MNSKFKRRIHAQGYCESDRILTIFLGVYNGAEYLDSLQKQLSNQTTQDFNLLVVDNNSSDDSLAKLVRWEKIFGVRLTLVSNSINLGAHGSMQNNLDLITTPWFSQIHQDDFYSSSHLETLISGIAQSNHDIVSVSTLMGSMTKDGKRVAPPPRAALFIKEFDQPSQVVQNIRTHCVPDPATAFKLEAFRATVSQWHSTAFPDSEQILKLCALGRFRFIPKETMMYRENPSSQSHSIEKSESELETCLALLRFFHSEEFVIVLKMVKSGEESLFINGILKALKFRITNEILSSLVSISLLEVVFQLTEYSEKSILKMAIPAYKSLGFKFPVDLLSNLTEDKPTSSSEHDVLNFQALAKFLALGHDMGRQPSNLVLIRIYEMVAKRIPLSFRMRLWKLLIKYGMTPGTRAQFDFEWRKSQSEKLNE